MHPLSRHDRAAALRQNAVICVPPRLIAEESIAAQNGGYLRIRCTSACHRAWCDLEAGGAGHSAVSFPVAAGSIT